MLYGGTFLLQFRPKQKKTVVTPNLSAGSNVIYFFLEIKVDSPLEFFSPSPKKEIIQMSKFGID